MSRSIVLALVLIQGMYGIALGGVKSKAMEEAMEFLARKFSREMAEEGAESLAQRIEKLAIQHGDDVLAAVKKVGPRGVRAIEEAGEHGPQVARLMVRHGNDAMWVVAKPNRMAIFLKYGDEAADALIKHGEVAEPVILKMGKPAAEALQVLSRQNGRRLAMMTTDGTLDKIGRTQELLAVIRKYGDSAMDFIWRNKGALTFTAALGAFLANPEPFIQGTLNLADVVGHAAVEPIVREASRQTNWTIVLVTIAVVSGGLLGLRMFLRSRRRRLKQPDLVSPAE